MGASQSPRGVVSASEGRAGSSAPALGACAQVPAALCSLFLLPHFEAGEQLDQPDIPLLWQEQEEEAQADDDDGDDPDSVEDDLAGVVIHHYGRQESGVLSGGAVDMDVDMVTELSTHQGRRCEVLWDPKILLSRILLMPAGAASR